jgi:hypothetical protein
MQFASSFIEYRAWRDACAVPFVRERHYEVSLETDQRGVVTSSDAHLVAEYTDYANDRDDIVSDSWTRLHEGARPGTTPAAPAGGCRRDGQRLPGPAGGWW